jgi:iron complex transport system permease protein
MRRSATLWTLILGLAALLAAWAAVALGSQQGKLVFMPGWPSALLHPDDQLQYKILLHLRAPRVAAGLVVGAALAVAGLLLQGVTRNPLADPYLLGISGGAGLMVVLLHAFSFLIDAVGWWLVPATAFAGAQAAAFLVLLLARGPGGRMTILGLILSGVVVNSFCAALMAFLLARFDPFRLRITTLWLAGSIGFARWSQLALVAAVTAAAWVYLRAQAHRLNALSLGTHGAQSVGVDAERLLLRSAVVSSVLTGLGVSLGGLLGYVGLIVPHAVRLLVGRDFRAALPVAAVAGPLLLVVADAVARLAFAPEELPVGVLTAILGCPLLLALLRAQIRGAS